MRNGALIPVTDPSPTAIELRDRTRPRRRRQRTAVDPCDEAGRRSAPAFTAGPGVRACERHRAVLRLPRGVELDDAGAPLSTIAARSSCGRPRRGAARPPARVGTINAAPFHPFVPRVVREFRPRCPDVALSLMDTLRRCSRGRRLTTGWTWPCVHFAGAGFDAAGLPGRCRLPAAAGDVPPRRGCACCAAPASSRVCRWRTDRAGPPVVADA